MIVGHDELNGPSIALYKDSGVKRSVESRLLLAPLAESIRFGSTCKLLALGCAVGSSGNRQLAAGGTGTSSPPAIRASDAPRIDAACFIALRVERLLPKRVRRPAMIWLCARSVEQLFGVIQVSSYQYFYRTPEIPVKAQFRGTFVQTMRIFDILRKMSKIGTI